MNEKSQFYQFLNTGNYFGLIFTRLGFVLVDNVYIYTSEPHGFSCVWQRHLDNTGELVFSGICWSHNDTGWLWWRPTPEIYNHNHYYHTTITILVRVPAYYVHANVWATTQHTFECPHERSKICCDVARTFGLKIIGGTRTTLSRA